MKGGYKFLLAIGVLCLNSSALLAQQTSAYHAVSEVAIGGQGFWDYLTVDSTAHRLYITRGTHVQVMDTESEKIVADIPNTPGVHGVAVAPKLGRGYISNGRENTVLIFDLNTYKEIQRVPVGKNPDAILYDGSTKRVFTFNGASSDVTALDAVTGAVLGTIPVGGKPEFAVSDEKGTIFCNVEDTSKIAAIDAKELKVKSQWSIAPAEEASGLAIDTAHHRLFAVAGNKKMAVVDYRTGTLLSTPEIGAGPDACVYDAKSGLAISSNGRDGTLTLVHTDSKGNSRVVGTVPTQMGARTMALDPKTHKVYLIAANFKPASGGGRPTMEPNSTVILVYAP